MMKNTQRHMRAITAVTVMTVTTTLVRISA